MVYFNMGVDILRTIGPTAILHMTKALQLLQSDLATIDRATTEVTISTIIAFAMVAFMSGDADSAAKHLNGLFKVLTMRGGLHSLRTCSYLQIKCCRLASKHHILEFNSTYATLGWILVMLCALTQSLFSLQPVTYPGIRISREAYQCLGLLLFTP